MRGNRSSNNSCFSPSLKTGNDDVEGSLSLRSRARAMVRRAQSTAGDTPDAPSLTLTLTPPLSPPRPPGSEDVGGGGVA